jgi:hypothetical protein
MPAQRKIGLIVSGGQTGPDRAALDFAIANHVPYGGWCPRGGWAEDRTTSPGILAEYPSLRETASEDVNQRTVWNVRDSDATLILTAAAADVDSPGTDLTESSARALGRPLAMVDVLAPVRAKAVVEALLDMMPAGGALNVAGPRESESPGIYDRSRRLLDLVLSDHIHAE